MLTKGLYLTAGSSSYYEVRSNTFSAVYVPQSSARTAAAIAEAVLSQVVVHVKYSVWRELGRTEILRIFLWTIRLLHRSLADAR